MTIHAHHASSATFSLRRHLRTTVLVASCASALIAGSATGASAHVTAHADTTLPGSYSTLTFAIPHGCAGSATTAVTMTIPDGIYTVKPTRTALWDISTTSVPVSPPIKGKHGLITSRTNTVTYTAVTPLPNDQRDAVDILVKLPQAAPGTTFYFPTRQQCEVGETNWSTIPTGADEGHRVHHPAPHVTLTAAEEKTAPSNDLLSMLTAPLGARTVAIASAISVIASLAALLLAGAAALHVFSR